MNDLCLYSKIKQRQIILHEALLIYFTENSFINDFKGSLGRRYVLRTNQIYTSLDGNKSNSKLIIRILRKKIIRMARPFKPIVHHCIPVN